MDTRNQIRENYRRLKGRVRCLERAVVSTRWLLYFLVDVFLLPIGWILKLWVWGTHKWTDPPLLDDLELETGGPTSILLDADGKKGRRVSEAELRQVVEHGLRVFGEHDIDAAARQRMIKRFAAACPDSLMFILVDKPEGQLRVGYTCILPLNERGYLAYRRGELRDYNISDTHLVSTRYRQRPRYLLIQAFALSERISKAWAKPLYEGIAYHISWHVDSILVSRPVLIAEAATQGGEKLLKRFAFARIGESANGVPLYELNTRDFERLPERARATIQLLDSLVGRFKVGRRERPRTRGRNTAEQDDGPDERGQQDDE